MSGISGSSSYSASTLFLQPKLDPNELADRLSFSRLTHSAAAVTATSTKKGKCRMSNHEKRNEVITVKGGLFLSKRSLVRLTRDHGVCVCICAFGEINTGSVNFFILSNPQPPMLTFPIEYGRICTYLQYHVVDDPRPTRGPN